MEKILRSNGDLINLKIVDDYCRNEFYSSDIFRKKNSLHNGTWAKYDGYDIISEKELRIKYKYGQGDSEWFNSYNIYLTNEYRDKNISDLLCK